MDITVLEKRLKHTYLLFDTLSAMTAWVAFFLFRKLVLEPHAPDTSLHALLVADPNFWTGLVVVPAGWLSLYAILGTYRNVLRKARLKELLETLVATLLGCVVIFFAILIDDELPSYRSHYAALLFLLCVHFLLTYLPRLVITSRTVHRVHSRRIGFPTLIVGNGPNALQTYLDLENQETYSGNLFVGYIAPDGSSATAPSLDNIMPRLGTSDDIPAAIATHHVQEVILALEEDQKARLNQYLLPLLAHGSLIVKITPDAQDLLTGTVRQQSIFHSPLITVGTRPMPEWQFSVKRLFDILTSALALVLLSPVYLITAIIVKATSPGPVFYAQERIGLHGKPFRMHKFRSMYVDAEQTGPALSRDDDPRITPLDASCARCASTKSRSSTTSSAAP